jgi:hypothetical protein
MRFVPIGQILTLGVPLKKLILPLTLKHGPESFGCSLQDFFSGSCSPLLTATIESRIVIMKKKRSIFIVVPYNVADQRRGGHNAPSWMRWLGDILALYSTSKFSDLKLL